MLSCLAYSISVLTVTSLWIVICHKLGKWSLRFLSLAMFFPGLIAALFTQNGEFWYQVLGMGKGSSAMTFSVMGGLFVILQLALVSGIDYGTGWGVEQDNRKKAPSGSTDLIGGFLRAAGEEIGWRCYLLPQLLNHFSPTEAIFISGLVWGLFHIPVMVLLMTKPHVTHPFKSIIFQFLHCVIQAFPMAWLAVKSEFSMWAPTVMHYVWNRLNPVIFGSIYSHQQGKIMGPLWLINGEGLAGCLAILPFALLCGWRLVSIL